MHDGEDIFGRRLSREVLSEKVSDESTGEEFVCEQSRETLETFGGAIEQVDSVNAKVLACGHLYRPGQRISRCDACSKKTGRSVYVCDSCVCMCYLTRLPICPKCAKIGPDGRLYSQTGFKQAERMGLFDTPQAASPVCAPARRSSLLGKLLEWW